MIFVNRYNARCGKLTISGSAKRTEFRIYLRIKIFAMPYRQLVMLLVILFSHAAVAQKYVEIKGVYGHPQKFWDAGYRLDELGVNAVFLHHSAISDSFVARARKENQKIYAEFATLNGKGYVEQHAEAWAIDNHGNRVEQAGWFMGVCPADTGFLNYRLNELATLLQRYDIDGVWLDYLHWHAQFEDPEPILPETCFNNNCINRFQRETGISIPGATANEKAKYILANHEQAWRKWRCTVIEDWVKRCSAVVREQNPARVFGIYHCPWNDVEYDSARTRILGLDYSLLEKHADVFSPMVYHERMGRKPEWVKENTEWFSKKIRNKKIWPIVQAYNDPGTVTADTLELVLRNAMSGRSTGVMMFTSASVAEDKAKVAAMKRVYSGR